MLVVVVAATAATADRRCLRKHLTARSYNTRNRNVAIVRATCENKTWICMCVCMCLRAQARISDSNLGRLGPGPAIQRLAPLDPVREFPDMPRRSRTRPGSTEPGLGSRPRADCCFFLILPVRGSLVVYSGCPIPPAPPSPARPQASDVRL